MLAKRIIPCLDVDQGRVVKGTKFVNIRDAGDPVELAEYYDKEGADELVFLDITASHEKRDIMLDVVKRTAEKVFIPFTVGGGIYNTDIIKEMLRAGADKVSINTAAIKKTKFVKEASSIFGAQCIVVAIDAKKIDYNISDRERFNVDKEYALSESSKWEVYTHGGRNRTGIDAVKWAKYVEVEGAGEVLLTSMDKDGTKDGYDLGLTKAICDAVNIPVIASGGAGKVEHIQDALNICEAALLASLLHYRELTIQEIKEYLLKVKIPVRFLGQS